MFESFSKLYAKQGGTRCEWLEWNSHDCDGQRCHRDANSMAERAMVCECDCKPNHRRSDANAMVASEARIRRFSTSRYVLRISHSHQFDISLF